MPHHTIVYILFSCRIGDVGASLIAEGLKDNRGLDLLEYAMYDALRVFFRRKAYHAPRIFSLEIIGWLHMCAPSWVQLV